MSAVASFSETTTAGWRRVLYLTLSEELQGYATVYPAAPPGTLQTPAVIIESVDRDYDAVGAWNLGVELRCIAGHRDNAAAHSVLDDLVELLSLSRSWDEWEGVTSPDVVEIGDGAYLGVDVTVQLYIDPASGLPPMAEVSARSTVFAALRLALQAAASIDAASTITADLSVGNLGPAVWADADWQLEAAGGSPTGLYRSAVSGSQQ